MGKPPRGKQEPGCRPRAARGGQTDAGNGDRRRHAALGAENSGGCCKVTAVGNVKVYGAPIWERRWVSGATKRF